MRGTKRQDAARLYAILQILAAPFEESELEDLTTDAKLFYAFNPDAVPIYRRKILKALPVRGLWWLDQDQWTRFDWHGHNSQIIRSGQDQDKVLTTLSFQPGWMYIREQKDHIDIEATSVTSKWDPEKKKRIGAVREWLTCSITTIEYKKLDTQLGPVENGCKHSTEGNYDFTIEGR